MVPGDAKLAADWIAESLPSETGFAATLPRLIEDLILNDCLSGCCLETSPKEADPRQEGGKTPRIVAIGLSGFITDEATDELFAEPDPLFAFKLLNRQLLTQKPRGFLSYEEIARANARGNLTLFPFLWLQSCAPNTPEGRLILGHGQRTFVDYHLGYRLKRLVKILPEFLAPTLEMGGMRAGPKVRTRGIDGEEMTFVLFDLTREEVKKRLPGSALAWLFETRSQRCRFTRAQQKAMLYAIEGLSSEEIGRALGKTKGAIDDLFKDAFVRFQDAFPAEAQLLFSDTRKRRQGLMDFFRDNIQELRPFDWKPST